MEITLWILSATVFTVYVGFVWIRYGVQKSISYSYYVIKRKPLFTLALWGFSIPAMIIAAKPLIYLAGVAICFVGIASDYMDYVVRYFIKDVERVNRISRSITWWVHMIGSYIGVFASQLSIFIDFRLWPLNVIFLLFAGGFKLFKVNNNIWWIEIAAFVLISGVLLYSII